MLTHQLAMEKDGLCDWIKSMAMERAEMERLLRSNNGRETPNLSALDHLVYQLSYLKLYKQTNPRSKLSIF